MAVHSKARHAFEGTATDPSERGRIVAALGKEAFTLTLENHGVVACGRTIPEALRYLWVHTRACMYQVARAPLRPAPPPLLLTHLFPPPLLH